MNTVPCSMCLENPAADKHRCCNLSIYQNKICDCCEECSDACKQEYYDMIDSGEADQEVIDFYNSHQ